MGIRVKSDNNYYYWFVGGMATDKFWAWFNEHPGFDHAEIFNIYGWTAVKLAKKYVTPVAKQI